VIEILLSNGSTNDHFYYTPIITCHVTFCATSLSNGSTIYSILARSDRWTSFHSYNAGKTCCA